jgi:hypothetical protein
MSSITSKLEELGIEVKSVTLYDESKKRVIALYDPGIAIAADVLAAVDKAPANYELKIEVGLGTLRYKRVEDRWEKVEEKAILPELEKYYRLRKLIGYPSE